ncbi:uncharacterized protein LOC133136539 [Conger conger]|uniref:uncharacterized protein LOC133136539 n=1 Tax=Conger conger TaxID=82655 RepID=UPI002A5A4606|nr:uncharacterized protein LOC133136539 [Conger conger]XP_061110093.1 uncharacterized protein LOC133136539 [Conger conger]
MKTPRRPGSVQHDCGVWLDTAHLRRRGKPVRLPRSISQLLNPLAPPTGYSIPAALSFTQTRLRHHTQSSISAFLSPRLHGKEEVEPAAAVATPLSPPDATSPQKKRKRLEGPEEPAYQREAPASSQPEEEEPVKKRVWTPALSHWGGKENRRPPPSSPPSPKHTQPPPGCLFPRRCPLAEAPVLFTQDSEGRRVILHRTPLQDCTNSSPWAEQPWTVPSRLLPQGEPDSQLGLEILFTQDSEGNRVIRH